MLVSLSVRDVVIIKNVELNFKNGFSTLTGETGAGKSILMDALGLVLGKRSESRLIRKGQEKAIVIAGSFYLVGEVMKTLKFEDPS